MWNLDKLIESLKFRDALDKIIDKRPGVSRLPAQLYLRLIVASIATNKDISGVISTALETYAMRNEQKHFDEIKIKAAAAGMELEEFLAEEVVRRIKKGTDTD
ncbi:MAG: hypothetical protein KME29_04995 [Calothrix sp. FI2-JRJ7]|jgi:hypothetical protein|nr:hypothetical protein [Calothrix sp. FI2-JRJ7]